MQLVLTTIFVINWNLAEVEGFYCRRKSVILFEGLKSEYLSCFTVVNWIAFLIEHRYTYVYAA